MDKPKDIKFLNDKASLYKFYSNSRNNIEDPLFTGFTLMLDMEHSPLFKSLIPPERVYDTLRSADGLDIVKSLEEGGDGHSIARDMENALYKMNNDHIIGKPDTYELNTIFLKDPLEYNGDRRRMGYGLPQKYEIDNVPYGASDYIYMVDKVSDGAYTDDPGVTDIGNGTPSQGIFDNYKEDLDQLQQDALKNQVDDQVSPNYNVNIFFDNDKYFIRDNQQDSVNELLEFLKNNPETKVQIDGFASKDNATAAHNWDLSINRCATIKNYLMDHGIDASRINTSHFGDTVQPFDVLEENRSVMCQVTGPANPESVLKKEIQKVSQSITEDDKNNHNALKSAMDEAYRLYSEAVKTGSDYDTNNKDLNKLNEDIDNQLYEFKKEVQAFRSTIESQLKLIEGDGYKTDARNLIASTYEQFHQMCDYFTYGPATLNNYNKKYPNISAKMTIVEKDEVEKFESEINALNEEQKKAYDDGEKDYYHMCWAVLKTTVNETSITTDTEKLRQDYKNKLNDLNDKIYGTHPDGRIGTKENPTPDSLYGKYLAAKDEHDDSPYLKKKQREDQLNDLQSHLDDIKSFDEANKDNVTVDKAMPSVDYGMTDDELNNPALYNERINRQRNTRNLYEPPQTYYDMMNFILGMKTLTNDYPYVFQSITGLDEAYNSYFEPKDPYLGSGDNKISIECLEFLDLRVSTMFNRYFNAVYDRQYRRERVPINLRRFQCSIFVHDIRNFSDSLTKDGTDLKGLGDIKNLLRFALNYVSAIEFKFFDCEIIPTETGNVFDSVSNVSFDMAKTKFTFKYGNCIINFLPFEDVKKYVLGVGIPGFADKDVKPNKERKEPSTINDSDNFENEKKSINSNTSKKVYDVYRTYKDENGNEYKVKTGVLDAEGKTQFTTERDNVQSEKYEDMLLTDDGNFRRWYDKSDLGNVNNNDYRDYVRHDAAVAVDDYFKTTIVNDFANGSLGRKNQELTAMNDALRRIVVGISASTGIPVKGVTDALNIKFIDPILNERDLAAPVAKDLGNAYNSKVVDTKTTEYIGTVIGEEKEENKVVSDLGNVEDDEEQKKGGN